jgi:hypothetical protein
VVRQLFSLLAMLPLQRIHCPVVATPLLGAGQQRLDPEELFPELLSLCRGGFRHVPDLQRLIVFDRQIAPLQQLATEIDRELGRSARLRERLTLRRDETCIAGLLRLLPGFAWRHGISGLEPDTNELEHLLSHGEATPLALGMHSRRLVEHLVSERIGSHRLTLYRGLQELQRQDVNPWILSCLHQVGG